MARKKEKRNGAIQLELNFGNSRFPKYKDVSWPSWMSEGIRQNVYNYMKANNIKSPGTAFYRMRDEDELPAYQDHTGIG